MLNLYYTTIACAKAKAKKAMARSVIVWPRLRFVAGQFSRLGSSSLGRLHRTVCSARQAGQQLLPLANNCVRVIVLERCELEHNISAKTRVKTYDTWSMSSTR